MQAVTFQIPRTNDHLAYTALKEAISKAGYSLQPRVFSLLAGSDLNGDNADQLKQLESILALDTIAIRTLSFTINAQGYVNVQRQMDNQKLKGLYDEVTVNPGEETDVLKAAVLIKELRTALHAIDNVASFDFLPEEHRGLAEAREAGLQRQEQMLQEFFADLRRFSTELTKTLTVDFQEKQSALDETHSKRMELLEEQYDNRVKQLDERESDLANQKKAIDDRESKHVRREIYKDINKKFVERNKAFVLTTGTRRLRVPIYVSTAVMLLLFLAGVLYYVFIQSPWSGVNDPWILGLAIARQVVLTLGFGLTAWFVIRWQNHWFQSHAEEEFKLKRLELDIDRASWVVEMAMEWNDAKGTEIPQFLIERLSRNLFESHETADDVQTPAESIAEAMLRSASGAHVKFGDAVELSFNPKGIKQLDQHK